MIRHAKYAEELLDFLKEISGKYILLGQHTQTRKQEELQRIKEVTGREPALCGFELLAYSGNINWDSCDEVALKELYENLGTVENALEWGRSGGIVTLTWHWYSPVGGMDKSFYSKNTDFNCEAALTEGTKEHTALLRDLDLMAVQLKRFQQEEIPVLWRPFHESEGDWFWWSVEGPKMAAKLYRFMFQYYTDVHHLDHLIWVWNSPLKEGYPGDDVVDVVTRDMYPPAHEHTAREEEYKQLQELTEAGKPYAIAEIGTQPDVEMIFEKGIPWTWYMVWSGIFTLTEDFTSYEQLKKNYNHPKAITKEKLLGMRSETEN